MEEKHVGTVTHYFPNPEVGVIKLTAKVEVGNVLRFQGHTTFFEQKITSMQIEHGPVESAKAKEEVAIKVDERVRPGDEVYLLGD